MSVTIDLKAAGLTHAAGKSDRCGGRHEVPDEVVTELDMPGLVDTGALGKVLQELHEQAHPKGAAYWENCYEPGCVRAVGIIEGED